MLVLSDLTAFLLVSYLPVAWPAGPFRPAEQLGLTVVISMFVYLNRGYRSFALRRPERELQLVCRATACGFAATLCAAAIFSGGIQRWPALLAGSGIILLAVLLGRFILRGLYLALWRRGVARQRVALAGPRELWQELQQRLIIRGGQGYELLESTFETLGEGALRGSGPASHWQSALVAWASGCEADVLLVSGASGEAHPDILPLVLFSIESSREVELECAPPAPAGFAWEVNDFTGGWRLARRPTHALERGVKAILERVIGLVGSVITLLLLPWVALILWHEDGGPLFYRSAYIGCDGKPHSYRKFRTMVKDADRILQQNSRLRAEFDRTCKLRHDPRVLPAVRWLRKYSLDEFPQFFSVLTGELALVGPRTISPAEGSRYGDLLPRLLSVKPGLTGYWQVMGRQTTSYAQRIRMDMFYIENWSIWLDLMIIGKTFFEVVRARGAF
ncbi:MAG TPA: sugar transferase [Terriglobales bacterium]|nr:sugar transferase [Terriglobales bacterium]